MNINVSRRCIKYHREKILLHYSFGLVMLLLLFLFDASASLRIVERGDKSLPILLEKIHEKLFPACFTATHFDRSWSNDDTILKVKQRKTRLKKYKN